MVKWDELSELEMSVLQSFQEDDGVHLLDEVKLLTIREIRLMKRITQIENEIDAGLLLDETVDEVRAGTVSTRTTKRSGVDLLLRAHSELTRVQAQKARTLEQIFQRRLLEKRIDIELLRLEIDHQAEEDTAELTSNFFEAMGGIAKKVWGGNDGKDN